MVCDVVYRLRSVLCIEIEPLLTICGYQGYFDEDSMDDFIASETEESSMSLSSEDDKAKK